MEITETILKTLESYEAASFVALGLYILFCGFVIVPLALLLYRYFSIKKTIIIVAIICIGSIAIHFIVLPVLGIFISLIFIVKKIYRLQSSKLKRVIVKSKSNSIYLKTKKGTLQIANIFRGVIISGGAGSGKSVSIFYPLIAKNGYSIPLKTD